MSARKKGNGTNPGAVSTRADKKISRDDIEAKMRELQGEVDENLDSAKSVAVPAAIGVAIVLVLVAYVLGRRKGRKRQLVLEIKRV